MGRLVILSVVAALLSGCSAGQVSLSPNQTTSSLSASGAGAGQIGHRVNKCPAWPGGSGILYDGDFHRAPDPGIYFGDYWQGQTFAPGWEVTRRDIDLYGSQGWITPTYKVCKIDLDGFEAGAIGSRVFATTPNSTYTVAFLFSGNDGLGPRTVSMEIKASGQRSPPFSWNTSSGHNAQNGVYQSETWVFTATSSSTSLKFVSLDALMSAAGPVVAAISVTKN